MGTLLFLEGRERKEGWTERQESVWDFEAQFKIGYERVCFRVIEQV